MSEPIGAVVSLIDDDDKNNDFDGDDKKYCDDQYKDEIEVEWLSGL